VSRCRYAARRAFRRRRGRPKFPQMSAQCRSRDPRLKGVQPRRRESHRNSACRHAGLTLTRAL
jgi:hypothetical protein